MHDVLAKVAQNCKAEVWGALALQQEVRKATRILQERDVIALTALTAGQRADWDLIELSSAPCLAAREVQPQPCVLQTSHDRA